MPTWLVIAGVVLVLVSLFARARSAQVKAIPSPKVRLFDLDGGKHATLLNKDRAWLTQLFADVDESSPANAHCDVLFIYGDISPDGRCAHSAATLGETIAAAGAQVVVVATANTSEAYIAASKLGKRVRVNLVMTLDRKGEAFAKFLAPLFTEMKRGTSMPVAWVKLAPQGPVDEHRSLPDTIFVCDAGQIVFA